MSVSKSEWLSGGVFKTSRNGDMLYIIHPDASEIDVFYNSSWFRSPYDKNNRAFNDTFLSKVFKVLSSKHLDDIISYAHKGVEPTPLEELDSDIVINGLSDEQKRRIDRNKASAIRRKTAKRGNKKKKKSTKGKNKFK